MIIKMASVARPGDKGTSTFSRPNLEPGESTQEHLASVSVASNRIPCNLTCVSLRPTKKRVPSVAWRTKSHPSLGAHISNKSFGIQRCFIFL